MMFLASDEAKVVDIFLRLDADFGKTVLDGSVTLTIEKVKPTATHVVIKYMGGTVTEETC